MSTKRPKYKITIEDLYSNGEDLGIAKIAHTATPAILKKGFAFNEQEIKVKPIKGVFADDLKYRISGPIMKAMDIYRNDEGEEYEVTFTKDVMDEMFQKFMSNLNNTKNNFNDEHLDIDAPSYILYAWTEEDGDEIWVTTQFRDKDVYAEYVEAGKTGYSIEGFLGMKMSEVIKQKMNNEKMTKNKFNLAPGEYPMANGSLLVIAEDGSVSILENEVVLNEEEVKEEEEIKEEELNEEEEVKEEEVKEEDLADEEEVAPEVEVPADVYSKEELDAKFEEIYKMIADLKTGNDVTPEVELNKDEKMSVHEAFAQLSKFTKQTPNVRF